MIRKSIKSFLIIFVATFLTYIGFANVIDPAIVISYKETSKDKVICEIENTKESKIILKAGNDIFGLSHILRKHSSSHFIGNEQKGSLFPEGTTGKQIIKGIETTYKNGQADPKAYGNNEVFWSELVLNGKKGKYRLVISEDKEIITFFKFRS